MGQKIHRCLFWQQQTQKFEKFSLKNYNFIVSFTKRTDLDLEKCRVTICWSSSILQNFASLSGFANMSLRWEILTFQETLKILDQVMKQFYH